MPPITHFSSVSAGLISPSGVGVEKPEPRLLFGGTSGSAAKRVGRFERQSVLFSDADSRPASELPIPSNFLRLPSRPPSRPGRSGKGPSRLQFPENLSSSNAPPPGRSFANKTHMRITKVGSERSHLRGSATLTRIVRLLNVL